MWGLMVFHAKSPYTLVGRPNLVPRLQHHREHVMRTPNSWNLLRTLFTFAMIEGLIRAMTVTQGRARSLSNFVQTSINRMGPQAKLRKVNALARALPADGPVRQSTRKNKKYVVAVNGRDVHFGHSQYQDFLDHGDPERRRRYLARAKGIRDGKGRLTWTNPESPNYWSVHVLW